MPDYRTPGVHIEEIPTRTRAIEGVGTSTTGFVGPTRYGPVHLTPEPIASLADRSIDLGTQWAVFEPNGEPLWASVRRAIEDFLLKEWRSGALLGDKPDKAFFVKCDRTTMTQNDLDAGRLVCLVGAAPLRPAEFIIFRIGQWTADHGAGARCHPGKAGGDVEGQAVRLVFEH